MIQEPACVRLELENRAENVALVRAALTGIAEAAELGEELATDLKTAVSEACNNVVIHAYEGDRGTMRVVIHYAPDRVDVVVRDHGIGIRRLSSPTDHMGLGLALISALADQAEFRSPPDGGAEVRMRFRRTEITPDASFPGDSEWPTRPPEFAEGDVVLWCHPVELVRHLMGRVARAAAASSHFTMTGASDLYAINDALAGYAEAAADGELVLALSSSAHRLTLDAGPFIRNVGDREPSEATPAATGGSDEVELRRAALAELVDQLSFERTDTGKLLHLLLLDRGRQPAG